jgi:hypothetical protein
MTPAGKTGTSVIKSAPPKETARITVKPNLPNSPVRAVGNVPTAKPVAAGGAGPVVAAAAAGAAVGAIGAAPATVPVKPSAKPTVATKPATTIIKSGGATTAKPAVNKPAVAVASTSSSSAYEEPENTMVTTIVAGVLAVLTWGTAGVLIASLMAWI